MRRHVANGGSTSQSYFEWLYAQIELPVRTPSYWILTKALYNEEFMPGNIPHDDNRAMDGLYLREEFIAEFRVTHKAFLKKECTFLEMLVALSRRMDFELSSSENNESHTYKYFWELVTNLGLTIYDDDHFVSLGGNEAVASRIAKVNERKYFMDGVGGLFPLRHAHTDQRYVEIWYQMMDYINERYPL